MGERGELTRVRVYAATLRTPCWDAALDRSVSLTRDKAAKLEYTPTEPDCFPLIRSRVSLEMHVEMDD